MRSSRHDGKVSNASLASSRVTRYSRFVPYTYSWFLRLGLADCDVTQWLLADGQQSLVRLPAGSGLGQVPMGLKCRRCEIRYPAGLRWIDIDLFSMSVCSSLCKLPSSSPPSPYLPLPLLVLLLGASSVFDESSCFTHLPSLLVCTRAICRRLDTVYPHY